MMRNLILLLFSVVMTTICYGQPTLDSLDIVRLKKIDQELKSVKKQLLDENKGYGYSDTKIECMIEYTLDTMKVNMLERRMMEEANYTTSGMYYAVWQAYEEYDKLLNKYYKLLISKLDPLDIDMLRTAQRSWMEFRDKETDLINTIYDKIAGSMFVLIRSGEILSLVQNRVNDLYLYSVCDDTAW